LPGIVRRVGNHNTNGRSLLTIDAFRVFRAEANFHILLLVFFFPRVIRHLAIDRLKCIHQADAIKRFVFPGGLGVGVLDVHRGDVIRQQHDFIAVQFASVFMR